MAGTLTLRVGDVAYLDAQPKVGGTNVISAALTVTSSDNAIARPDKIEDCRYSVRAVAAGAATLTAAVGAVSDTLAVTVIAADAVSSVSLVAS